MSHPSPTSQPDQESSSGDFRDHPVGTGVGAATGGAAGAMIGSAAGPIGTALGAVIGAIAGSYAGRGIAELIDPDAEDSHWREQHPNQPFAQSDLPFDAYANAYRTGYCGYREGQKFEQRESDLRMEYEGGPQRSDAEKTIESGGATMAPVGGFPQLSPEPLRWEDARDAARAAYERVERGEAHRRKSD